MIWKDFKMPYKLEEKDRAQQTTQGELLGMKPNKYQTQRDYDQDVGQAWKEQMDKENTIDYISRCLT